MHFGGYWRERCKSWRRVSVLSLGVTSMDMSVGAIKQLIGVHGGNGLGEVNMEGERIIDHAISFDKAIVNTFFTKNPEHQITYKSGGRTSQIDYIYMLCRRTHLKEVIDCKVIPGDHVTPQHQVLCMDLRVKYLPKIQGKGSKEDQMVQIKG